MIYSTCGSPCRPTCENPDFAIICMAMCEEGCFCPTDRPILLPDGTCGTLDKCNSECPGETTWNDCGSLCTPTCEEPNPVCTEQCVKGCFCPRERPIELPDGRCVAADDCPPKCPGDKVFNRCGSACPSTCEDPDPPCTKQCVARCTCPMEAPIELGNDRCGTIQQCKANVIDGGELPSSASSACSRIRNRKSCKARTGCRWSKKTCKNNTII